MKRIFQEFKMYAMAAKYIDDMFNVNEGDVVMFGDESKIAGVDNTKTKALQRYISSYFKREIKAIKHIPSLSNMPGVGEKWFFINGIQTIPAVAKVNAGGLEKLFNRPIDILYNPTNGIIKDLAECFRERVLDDTQRVSKSAASIIKPYLEQGTKVVLIGHSQGGIICSQVAETLVNQKVANLNNLSVFTFAGAQDEFPKLSTGIYSEHFANEGDFVANIGVIQHKHLIENVYIRPSATGHLLNQHYLYGFYAGLHCNQKSKLHSMIKLPK